VANRGKLESQGVIPVVTNRGIGPWFATKEWQPVPYQSLYSRRHIILMSDLTGVKPICGELLHLNYTWAVSVCHTISWHYTFKG
jgi:hypothetical protein